MTSSSPELAIIDTSIYVDNFRSARFEERLQSLPFHVRLSAVVAAELTRGAVSRQARRFVDQLIRNLPIVAPTDRDWMRSGQVIRTIPGRHGFDIHKLRNLHFDVLIALTARRLGAHMITTNAQDFQTIRRVVDFKLICW